MANIDLSAFDHQDEDTPKQGEPAPTTPKLDLSHFDAAGTEAPTAAATNDSKGPSVADAALRGAANGASAGFADEATAGLGAVKDYLAAKFGLRGDIDLPDAYHSWLKTVRGADQASQQAHPGVFGAAQLGGGALLATAPGASALNAGAEAGLGEMAAKGAAQGAAAGYGNSDAATMKGDLANTAIGAGVGGLAGGVLGAAGKAKDAASDYLNTAANSRAVKALAPTLKQQELLNSRDVANELGQGLRDQGVVKFGSSVNDMAPRLEDFLTKKGARIGEIRNAADQAGANVDMRRIQNMADIQQEAAKSGNEAGQAMADAYSRNADRFASVPDRNLKQTQEEISGLNYQIPFERPNADMTPSQQAFKSLRGDLVGQMNDQIASKTPELSPEYQNLLKQFSLFKNAEPILDKSVARQSRNADFGLRDLLSAGLPSNGGPAAGLKEGAMALGSKLARERGNSAAASTFGALSNMLKTNPAGLGKYGPILKSAAERGIPALMATHQALINDPDYQQTLSSNAQHFADGGVVQPDPKAASDAFAKMYGTNPDANQEPGIQEDSVVPGFEGELQKDGYKMGAAPVPPEMSEDEMGTPAINYGNAPKKTITQATTGFKPSAGVKVMPDSSTLSTQDIAALLKKLNGGAQ